MHENLADTITPNFNINPDVLKPGYKVPAYKTQQHNPSNMAQFGMSQEHKDVLRRKNRVFLLEELDPEPIIQRLFQINMNSKTALEDIQALPTNYRKGVALLQQLPKHGPCAFAYFCRALSASGQNHMRNKIQESVMWCIGFITLLNYDGETLHLQKGICRRSISITHSEWNNLILYIPKILENLDPCKDSKFCLSDENLYVTTSKHQAHKYVGFHRGGDGSGVTMDMDEWGDFLKCVAFVIDELNESHPTLMIWKSRT